MNLSNQSLKEGSSEEAKSLGVKESVSDLKEEDFSQIPKTSEADYDSLKGSLNSPEELL